MALSAWPEVGDGLDAGLPMDMGTITPHVGAGKGMCMIESGDIFRRPGGSIVCLDMPKSPENKNIISEHLSTVDIVMSDFIQTGYCND